GGWGGGGEGGGGGRALGQPARPRNEHTHSLTFNHQENDNAYVHPRNRTGSRHHGIVHGAPRARRRDPAPVGRRDADRVPHDHRRVRAHIGPQARVRLHHHGRHHGARDGGRDRRPDHRLDPGARAGRAGKPRRSRGRGHEPP